MDFWQKIVSDVDNVYIWRKGDNLMQTLPILLTANTLQSKKAETWEFLKSKADIMIETV